MALGVSGSTSMEGRRNIAQTPPLARVPGKQQQPHLTLCSHGHKPNIYPGPTLSQGNPVSAITGQHSWALLTPSGGGVPRQVESSRLWQAQEGSRSGGDTVHQLGPNEVMHVVGKAESHRGRRPPAQKL